MPSELSDLTRAAFAEELAAVSPLPLGERAVSALYAHFVELRRWNRRLGLIGPGTAGEVMTRHYGEALAALPLIPAATRHGVDLGSGAGFPGLVLAAVRPELEMTLVEAREKKWSFLVTAARKAGLPCHCLNARVASPLPDGLPEEIGLVTVRALKLECDVLRALAGRLAPGGSILLWTGEREPDLPPELSAVDSVPLAGSTQRRLLELRCAPRVGFGV
jgi:16S rRNA (guanine(527)-N(7))-methyltransferase RsmG